MSSKQQVTMEDEEEFMQVDEENDHEEEINIEDLNEKFDQIMKKFENLNIEKEVGEKEKNKDSRIIIERIELENFKSYAGVKKIGPLHNSFNSVVGPNGSGKSNLMESLLFVFGKRAKKMRLNKLNELIHNSTKENNLRFARVSVYFKEIREVKPSEISSLINDPMYNKKENYVELPNSRFDVTREVYKNASSKYFYSGKEISFDQLGSILIRKGIDLKHNRFLILQGEVEQISMMKPKATSSQDVGLLEFLEDIIGTNRYVNLIEKLNKDIDELSEIKNQKINRVKIAKNEVDQLEDIKNASLDYYKLEKMNLLLVNLSKNIQRHQINKHILSFNEKITQATSKIQDSEKAIQVKIQENKHVLEQHSKIKAQQDLISIQIQQLTEEFNKYTEFDQEKRTECDNITKQIDKNKAHLEKYNKTLNQQYEEIDNSTKQLPVKEKEFKVILEKKNELEQFVAEKEQSIFDKTKKLQAEKIDVESKLHPFNEKINILKSNIEQNQSQIKMLEDKAGRSQEEFKILKEKQQEFDKDLEGKNKILEQTLKKMTSTQNQIKEIKTFSDKINLDLQNKSNIANNFMNKINEIRSSNQEKVQKNNLLDNLLKAQAEGRLKGIHGRLGDLGKIDMKYDIAITTACAALDHIVVDTVDQAQKGVEYLRKYNLGRATFICLDKVSWVESKMNENKGNFQNAERLFDLVQVKNKMYLIAFYFALRDTLVASDLKTATTLGYGSVRRRVVTLSGELIETSGVMSGGGKPRKGGMSSKLSEEYTPEYINQLNTDYDAVVKDIQKLRDDKLSLENQFNSLNRELNDLNLAKKKLEFDSMQIEKALGEIDKNLSQLNSSVQKAKEENVKVEKLKKESADKEKEIIAVEKNCAQFRESLNKIEAEIAKIGGEEYNKKKEELKNLKKKVNDTEKEINMMKNTVSMAGETVRKTKDEIELKQKTISDYQDLLKKTSQEITDLEEKAMKVYKQIEASKLQEEEMFKQFDEKKKEVEEFKVIIKSMKEEQEKIRIEITEAKNEITRQKKNEKSCFEEITKNKSSYKKLIEEFGFIDSFEKDMKNIQKINNKNEENIEVDEEENENDQQSQRSKKKMFSKSKKIHKDYSKFKDPKYMEIDLVIEELEELSLSKEEILYESLLTSNELKTKQHNMDAIKVYKKKIEDLKSREDDLNKTTDKHSKCKKIFELVKRKRFDEFMEGFNAISSRLKEMYQLITHGGDAELELLDSLDPFSEGISFSVRPYKKSWKQISNLSGGEKTLSSLSLIFALHHYKPSPLYVMDEIDAALDFKNVSIIANYIKEQTKNSQFIIISLRNHMFEIANKLIGIYKTHDITKCLTFDPESCKLKSKEQVEAKDT